MSRTLKTAAALAALSLTVVGCANSSDTGSSTSGGGSNGNSNLKSLDAQSSLEVPKDAVKAAGDGKAKCAPGTTIAFIGAMTGDNAQLGINEYQGVQLAINEHNKANPDCQVTFKKYDTEGDPTKATGPVTQAVGDKNIIGVVGLPFSGESKATGAIFEQAGLVHITPSATNPSLTGNGWKTFFRGLGNDNIQGPAAAILAEKLGAKKVYLVQDDSDYGIGLGGTAKKALQDKSLLAGEDKVTTKQKDFSSTVQKIINSKADAVFFAGYYAEGAPLNQQLVAKGFKGAFIGPDGVKDDQFIKLAGDSSKNAYFTCPCIPGELIPDFASAYKGVANAAPGTYSVESYDAATVLLAGIQKGNTDRPKLLNFVKSYDGQGLSKKIKWDDKGELSDLAVYGYKVDGGKIVSVGKLG
ncbi:branched-chain amino acid ABC transporter substrate-binding protein [Yimella sp. cx-51]|uniref:branched-chain amino acid ABC transporter substrate-binding protein n=1 Tax=Yimella sp. cx-51 TaxID=2770551 RepID=UPI001FCBE22B|nr:branched-chain amino acid ABC transporter substrate-binding protein [Yimella sp. cx-51]